MALPLWGSRVLGGHVSVVLEPLGATRELDWSRLLREEAVQRVLASGINTGQGRWREKREGSYVSRKD